MRYPGECMPVAFPPEALPVVQGLREVESYNIVDDCIIACLGCIGVVQKITYSIRVLPKSQNTRFQKKQKIENETFSKLIN